MAKYNTTWLDYKLPTGYEFAVAVCGYSGKIRHMILEEDPLRRQLITSVEVTGKICRASEHCLARSCPLNKTNPEHMAHMLDMWVDEPLDGDVSEIWKTGSTVEALVQFADKMNEAVPEELRKKQPVREKPPRKKKAICIFVSKY